MKINEAVVRRVLILGLFVLGCVPLALGADQDWDWNYNIFYGRRVVGDKDWDPFEKYQEIGVEGTWGKADQPLMFATDAYYGSDRVTVNGFKVESNARELAVGLRKLWTVKKRFHPYFGAGIAFVQSSYEQANKKGRVSETDGASGLWLGGGLFYRLGPQINLGIALRLEPMREFKLLGEPRDGSSTHLGIVLGWGAVSTGEN